MLAPFKSVCELNVQLAAGDEEQLAEVKLPDKIPLVQILFSETHCCPKGTDAD